MQTSTLHPKGLKNKKKSRLFVARSNDMRVQRQYKAKPKELIERAMLDGSKTTLRLRRASAAEKQTETYEATTVDPNPYMTAT